MQGVAGFCRVLQGAARESVESCVVVCCSVLQCVAVCCNVLQGLAKEESVEHLSTSQKRAEECV